jgi:alkylation response protein AidB-like acyl-CoA dehydrogenase
MLRNERILHFDVMAAASTHAHGVPVVDDFSFGRGNGDQQHIRGAVGATARFAVVVDSRETEKSRGMMRAAHKARASEAEIVDNWNTMGMRGSGSHDVEMKDAFIPEHWAVPWRPLEKPGSADQGPLYRLTVWPAIAALVPPALGIARAAIDEAIALITTKTSAFGTKTLRNQALVQSQLARAEAKLGAARAYFYGVFEEAWQEAVAARPITLALKAKMQLAMTHAVFECAAAVDLIHEIVGASGIREEYAFSRHFRDIHVITQHGFINAAKLEPVGQIMLGLEPDWPFFRF